MNINISENESSNNFQTKKDFSKNKNFYTNPFRNSKKKRNTANNKLVYINEEKINRINLYINNIEKQKEIERERKLEKERIERERLEQLEIEKRQKIERERKERERLELIEREKREQIEREKIEREIEKQKQKTINYYKPYTNPRVVLPKPRYKKKISNN